ncbi:MAG: hypothetical protein FJ115_13840 [Deltaproteobacteria bacterium]|nr:hypothetical protein [Deltaproteobacteria bacterium]
MITEWAAEEKILVFLQTLILMGDWCRQDSMIHFETDTENSKETTAKEKMGMTRWICFAHSDATDGNERRYSSCGRDIFLY